MSAKRSLKIAQRIEIAAAKANRKPLTPKRRSGNAWKAARARAKALSPERRSEIARKGGAASKGKPKIKRHCRSSRIESVAGKVSRGIRREYAQTLSHQLIPAVRTEAKFALQEPRPAPGGARGAGPINDELLCRVRAAIASQPCRAVAAQLQPLSRIICRRASERVIVVVLRLGHQIAGLFNRTGIVQWRLVDIARQEAFENDGVMLLSAVAAEEGSVKPRLRIIWIEALTVQSDRPLGC